MSAQNDKTLNAALDDDIEQQEQENTLTHEYGQALSEAQTRLEALTASFALFIGEDHDPDILGYQCVIDDADRLAGTVRQLYHLAKNAKAAQQLESVQSTQNQTELADDPHGFDPDYSHHDMCADGQDDSGFVESLSRNGHMAGSIINLNRKAYLAEGDSEKKRDDAYYSMLAVRMTFQDTQALTRAWIESINQGCVSLCFATIDANTLAMIDEITSRAIDVLSDFINVLAGAEPITDEQIIVVLESLEQAIANIEDVVRAYLRFTKSRQA